MVERCVHFRYRYNKLQVTRKKRSLGQLFPLVARFPKEDVPILFVHFPTTKKFFFMADMKVHLVNLDSGIAMFWTLVKYRRKISYIRYCFVDSTQR